ncbi:MAG TPA: metallophosphoesterase [Candidatus Sulfotelmatobacter sp.]|nr:metallophosphoesterase [Candidatus Sulfotelmatobacter sp.]
MSAMRPFRVIQVSDTHLSRQKPCGVPNFAALTAIVAAERPDLVINSGDIALDGADDEDDLVFANECHRALAAPLRAIPGNHDLGDNPWGGSIAQPITDARRARYIRHFGADFWQIEAGSWLLVGLNAQLFGSGLAGETEQWAFLERAAASAGRRPLALFVHKPLFNERPTETEVNHRYVNPDHRRRLFATLGDAALRLVASGHVHQHRRSRVDGIDYCWAPSTAFVLPDRMQPVIGTKRVGYVAYSFGAEDVAIDVVETPKLVNNSLDDFPPLYDH